MLPALPPPLVDGASGGDDSSNPSRDWSNICIAHVVSILHTKGPAPADNCVLLAAAPFSALGSGDECMVTMISNTWRNAEYAMSRSVSVAGMGINVLLAAS